MTKQTPRAMQEMPLCLCGTVWVHLCPEHVPSTANPYARVRTLTAALLQTLSTAPHSPSADDSKVRRYSVEENYSEVIEDGAVWVRATDHDALVSRLTGDYEALREALAVAASKAIAEREKLIAARDAALADARRLQDELEQIQPNARRYLWLRAGGPGSGLYVADSGAEWRAVCDNNLDERIDDELDAIDTAIAAQPGNGREVTP